MSQFNPDNLPEGVEEDLEGVTPEQRQWILATVERIHEEELWEIRGLVRVGVRFVNAAGRLIRLLEKDEDTREWDITKPFDRIKEEFPNFDVTAYPGFKEAVIHFVMHRISDEEEPVGVWDAMDVKQKLGEGIDFRAIPEYEQHVKRWFWDFLTRWDHIRALRVKEKLGGGIDFTEIEGYAEGVKKRYMEKVVRFPKDATEIEEGLFEGMVEVSETEKEEAAVTEMDRWLDSRTGTVGVDIAKTWGKRVDFAKRIPNYAERVKTLFLAALKSDVYNVWDEVIKYLGTSYEEEGEGKRGVDIDFTEQWKEGMLYWMQRYERDEHGWAYRAEAIRERAEDIKFEDDPAIVAALAEAYAYTFRPEQMKDGFRQASSIKEDLAGMIDYDHDPRCVEPAKKGFLLCLNSDNTMSVDLATDVYDAFLSDIEPIEANIPGLNKATQKAFFVCMKGDRQKLAVDIKDKFGGELEWTEAKMPGYEDAVRKGMIRLLAVGHVSVGRYRFGFFDLKETLDEGFAFEGEQKAEYEQQIKFSMMDAVRELDRDTVARFMAEYPEQDFSADFNEVAILQLTDGKPDRFESILRVFVEHIDKQNVLTLAAEQAPATFAKVAQRSDWQLVFGGDVMTRFLQALPTATDERRNAFTHNQYDRTSEFFESMAEQMGALNVGEMEVATQFVERFGLSKTGIIYRYLRNIVMLERGKIEELPEAQVANGCTTKEALMQRVEKLQQQLYGDAEMRDFGGMGDLEIEILGAATGYSSHIHHGSGVSLPRMVADFDEQCKSGEVTEVPEAYDAVDIPVSEATIVFDKGRVRADYNALAPEFLAAIEHPEEVEDLREAALGLAEEKIKALQPMARNEFIQKQIAAVEEVMQEIRRAGDLDELMAVVIGVKAMGKKNIFIPVMRQISLRKAFGRGHSGEALTNLAKELRAGMSGKGILGMVGKIGDLVKGHVLNMKKDNEERYWSGRAWEAIRDTHNDRKMIDVTKLFSPHYARLAEEARNFEILESDVEMDVRVVPDRGFAGEMSSYLGNVCYSAVYPLLKGRDYLVPHKLLLKQMNDDSEETREFFGSFMVFELEDARGRKVLLLRPFNVPREGEINIGKFIETNLDRLERIAAARGCAQVVIPGVSGAISNYPMTIGHFEKNYIKGKKPVSLKEKFDFNGYDLTDNCYVVRELSGEEIEEGEGEMEWRESA